MTVVLTGSGLTVDEVVRIARHGEHVELAPDVRERVRSGREVVERALAPGEGLALLGHNAFSTGHAALAVADAGRLLDSLDAAGALDLEAFAANVSMLHPAIACERPFPGLAESLHRLRELLDESC